MDSSYARTVWRVLEPLHAVTYFAPECREANRAVGLRGFWMGYFGSRAAPLGPVPPGVVEATFYNFHPARVRRAIPDAWSFASPAAILDARSAAAAEALRRVVPHIGETAAALNPLLASVVEAADGAGRPIFAANRDLPQPEDPVAALWQAATSLREHRGDGHVAALTAEGLDGCEVHVLMAVAENTPPEILREARGWSPEEWDAATRRLAERGLLHDARGLRARIESRTDDLAVRPYRHLDDPARLLGRLTPLARGITSAGLIPFPNPIGLPAPGAK